MLRLFEMSCWREEAEFSLGTKSTDTYAQTLQEDPNLMTFAYRDVSSLLSNRHFRIVTNLPDATNRLQDRHHQSFVDKRSKTDASYDITASVQRAPGCAAREGEVSELCISCG